MQSIQLSDTDRTALIRLGQLATGTARYDKATGKIVVMPNLAYQLPENLRKSDGRHSRH
jgi:hypothetical protein